MTRMIGASALLVVLLLGAGFYLGWGRWPAALGDRIWIVILVLAIVGIPLGIRMGEQRSKFWA